jgi:hypothetical protein
MPRVTKDERYVEVGYELNCGFERATALADDLAKVLKDDDGFFQAKDDTRRWDGDRKSLVVVIYETLADANRLDQKVRQLLSRKTNFTYEAFETTYYGSTGARSSFEARTTLEEVA